MMIRNSVRTNQIPITHVGLSTPPPTTFEFLVQLHPSSVVAPYALQRFHAAGGFRNCSRRCILAYFSSPYRPPKLDGPEND